MPRLRILHIDPERSWGGGEGQVYELTTHLHRFGHHSVVATDPHGTLYDHLAAVGLPVCPLAARNHLDVRAGLRLRRLVRTGRYDLVHFHTSRAHALSPWLQGMGVKRVVTRRMDYAIKRNPVSRFLYTRSVDAVVAISASVRDALGAGTVPLGHIRLIPSGIDTARFTPIPDTRAHTRSAYGFGDHETVILSIGALVERKGHRTLLHAAYLLQQQGVALRYLVCGEGPLRRALETEARALGLGNILHFAGFCPDVVACLAAADVFVHVPLWEGLGVAVIEALAAGVPVIASQVGGIPELIDGQTTGLLVPSQDPTALAAALSRFVLHPNQARAFGQAGQALARTRFDVTVMARANEALYYELLKGKRSSGVMNTEC